MGRSNYITWLKNHLPSRAIPGHTPYEFVHKTKPNLAQAHEFGARVYVHLQDAGKLEAKAEEAIFIGVDDESKGYRIFWPQKCCVSIECNVSFIPSSVTIALNIPVEGESSPSPSTMNDTQNVLPIPQTPPAVPSAPPVLPPPAPRETR